jgi:hypothetical protein
VVLPPEHDTLHCSPDGHGPCGPEESLDPPASPPTRLPPLPPPLLPPLPPPLLLLSSPPPELEVRKPGLSPEPPQPGDPGSARSSSASDARTARLESHRKRREGPRAQCLEGRGPNLDTTMRFMREQNGPGALVRRLASLANQKARRQPRKGRLRSEPRRPRVP